jgi:ribonuclease T2
LPDGQVNRSQRLLAGAAMAAAMIASSAAAQDRQATFEFYVLSLTWMPGFCASDASGSGVCQTRADAGFLLHGLWPQREHGYPEYRASSYPKRIPAELGASMSDIMPDRRLVFSEWRKHGVCSGLSPERYFSLTREAFRRVVIPDRLKPPAATGLLSGRAVESAFVAANPGLPTGGLAVSCANGRLREVRICMDRDLSFRTCAEVAARGCRAASLIVGPVH